MTGFLRILPLIVVALLFLSICGNKAAADPVHPLAPPDTSSPRATLSTFLNTVNEAVAAYKAGDEDQAVSLAERASRCLNLEEEPPALHYVVGLTSALYLKEVLDRIEIPPYEEIPDAEAIRKGKLKGWTIPYTEITIASVHSEASGPRFLFSAETVKKAQAFYDKVKQLPYRPDSGHGALIAELETSGSLILGHKFLNRLPGWAKTEIYGEAVWQWLGLILYSFVYAVVVLLVYKWSGKAEGDRTKTTGWAAAHALRGLILPLAFIIFASFGLWFLVYGLRFLNLDAYVPIAFAFLVISYAGWIWLIGAVLNRLADILAAVGGFARGGLDDQVIRLGFTLLTMIVLGVMAVDLGARLGLPTYSLVTGLGIGGIAVALAGREALSNIIGTVMIILDRPFRLGDYIDLQDGERGAVAEVGLRSTRIRTRDDILVSIPNSVIANSKMINESAPVARSRIRIKVGVGYDSDLTQVEHVLLDVAEKNERVLSEPSPRIRFRSFGDSSLEFELLCWIALPAQRGRTTHELNWAIKEEFERRSIEIPFPQRDIHIRSEKSIVDPDSFRQYSRSPQSALTEGKEEPE